MSYVMVATYILSMLVLVLRLVQEHQKHFDGCGKAGYATAAFLLLCPGVNTLLAIEAIVSWPGQIRRQRAVKELS